MEEDERKEKERERKDWKRKEKKERSRDLSVPVFSVGDAEFLFKPVKICFSVAIILPISFRHFQKQPRLPVVLFPLNRLWTQKEEDKEVKMPG
jgi:hypothetical protein